MKRLPFAERIKRLAAYEYAPVILPYFFAKVLGGSASSQVHRFFLKSLPLNNLAAPTKYESLNI
jgi:hypothetical protein